MFKDNPSGHCILSAAHRDAASLVSVVANLYFYDPPTDQQDGFCNVLKLIQDYKAA